MAPPEETFQLPPSDTIVRLLSNESDDPDTERLIAAIAALGGQTMDAHGFARAMARTFAEACRKHGIEEAGDYRARLIGYIKQVVGDEAARDAIVKRL